MLLCVWYCIKHIATSTRLLIWMSEKNTIKLHVQIFQRLNTWLFETRQRQYNWIKSLTQKVCILLVLITYVYHNAQSKKHRPSVALCCCDIHCNSCACRGIKVKSQPFIKHHSTETLVLFLALLTWPRTCHCAPSDRNPVPFGYGSGRGPQPHWTLWRRQKISASGGTKQFSSRNKNINIAYLSANDIQWPELFISKTKFELRNHSCICCLMICVLCTAVWQVWKQM